MIGHLLLRIYSKCGLDSNETCSSAHRPDDIEQMFTFTDLTGVSTDVTFISLYKNGDMKSGVCQEGMVEFLTTSTIYTLHKQVQMALNGHIFEQGDLRVHVGSLLYNHPKYLLV